MTKEQINNLAEAIKPIMLYLDIILVSYKPEDIKVLIDKMEHNNALLSAWPFPETLNKAETQKLQLNTFRALYKLLEARKEQINASHKSPPFATGDQINKLFGL